MSGAIPTLVVGILAIAGVIATIVANNAALRRTLRQQDVQFRESIERQDRNLRDEIERQERLRRADRVHASMERIREAASSLGSVAGGLDATTPVVQACIDELTAAYLAHTPYTKDIDARTNLLLVDGLRLLGDQLQKYQSPPLLPGMKRSSAGFEKPAGLILAATSVWLANGHLPDEWTTESVLADLDSPDWGNKFRRALLDELSS